MTRISVVRDRQSVPLLPARPLSQSPSLPSGLIVERHSIDAIEIPEHEHHTLCLHMQTSGPIDMEWWTGGRHGLEHPTQGSLILIAPGTRDRLRWAQSSRRVIVSIDDDLLRSAATALGRKSIPEFHTQWHFEDPQLRLLLTEISREMNSGWATGALYADQISSAFATALIQRYGTEGTLSQPAHGGISKARLRHVLDFIAENSHRDLRLDDLAQTAGISSFHFARLFRQSTGVTPHRYLLQQRLQNAQQLLNLRTRSIAEIATETGFTSPGDLSRTFRRHFGISPTDWQNKL